MTKFIVVAGGVISGVGKGVTTASIGKILQAYGYSVTLVKIDPYINVDAGTLRPTEHGEVWVTEDGGEIDQDLGTYERFMGNALLKKNSITTGQIYKSVIDKERAGYYLGKTVQFVPHIIEEIKARVQDAAKGYDIAVIEIGGIVGDYENVPYLFAFKSLERELGMHNIAHVLVTYMPVPSHIGEMKTKPTQQAIRLMGQEGILPHFIMCRSKVPLDAIRRKKIEAVANIPEEHVISAPDVASIYELPLYFERERLGEKLIRHLRLKPKTKPDLSSWKKVVAGIKAPKRQITIGIIGKYIGSGDFALADSYLSVYHAVFHAGAHTMTDCVIRWIDAQKLEQDHAEVQRLCEVDAVIVPGGFGTQGVEGKIAAIRYVRQQGIPYLGLCYGMQLAVIEYARARCGIPDAHTTEIDAATSHPVITILPWQKKLLNQDAYGGTMRLGAYAAQVKKGSKTHALYKQFNRITKDDTVIERHRHRYEVNNAYIDTLEQRGALFSGYYVREDGTQLVEFFELPDHPFFIATQAHPEFTSRLLAPHPLFVGLVQAAIDANARRCKDDVLVAEYSENGYSGESC